MEEKNTHMMYGALAGIGSVAVSLLLHVTKTEYVTGLAYLSMLPPLVFLILNARAFSKQNDGYVTFGSTFGSCFKATMIFALIVVAWNVVALFVMPELKEQYLENMRTQAAKNPSMTDEMLDTSVNFMNKWYTTIIISGAVFGSLIFGSLMSVIAAAVAPKKGERPTFDM